MICKNCRFRKLTGWNLAKIISEITMGHTCCYDRRFYADNVLHHLKLLLLPATRRLYCCLHVNNKHHLLCVKSGIQHHWQHGITNGCAAFGNKYLQVNFKVTSSAEVPLYLYYPNKNVIQCSETEVFIRFNSHLDPSSSTTFEYWQQQQQQQHHVHKCNQLKHGNWLLAAGRLRHFNAVYTSHLNYLLLIWKRTWSYWLADT